MNRLTVEETNLLSIYHEGSKAQLVENMPPAAAWRMLVEKDDAAEAARLHRLALDGRDFRKDPAWAQWDAMATTTGHYFRGVE